MLNTVQDNGNSAVVTGSLHIFVLDLMCDFFSYTV